MDPLLYEFYKEQEAPIRSCLEALRDIILSCNPQIKDVRKYGMPGFSLDNKMICYLWTDKKTKEPYVLWVMGKQLDHPLLEAGDRARMKILRINVEEDLPIRIVEELVRASIDLLKDDK